MSLVVGSNTYVTREQADSYIKSTYAKASKARKSWDLLDFTDKDAYLVNATMNMQNIEFNSSETLGNTQKLVFPREGLYGYRGSHIEINKDTYSDYMIAQIEEALHLMLSDIDVDYLKVLKSRTVGKVSETYQVNATDNQITEHGISYRAFKYIKDWTTGSY